MLINCFRASGASRVELDDDRPSRPVRKSRLRRNATSDSTSSQRSNASSVSSNDSISRLPPCTRPSDPKIDAMMMPLPHDARPSKCLRLSHPRIYGNLVCDMKASKGCRDWRNFDVFYADDVDMSISADEAARKRAIDYQRKWKQINSSFESEDTYRSTSLDAVDMIG